MRCTKCLRAISAGLILHAGLALVATPSHAGSAASDEAAESTPSDERLRFTTRIEGMKIPDDLRERLSDAVELGRDKTPPPPSLGQLRRRAASDADRLGDVLRSEGYYNADVEPVVQEEHGGRFAVIYRVALGPRTMIRGFLIAYQDHPSDEAALPGDGAALGLKPQRAARAERVIGLTEAVLAYLENHGHPHPRLIERKVVVDLAAHVADVTLTIEAGPRQRFGDIVIENGGRTKPAYVRSLATFKTGDLYDRRKVDETIAALRQTGLFDRVSIEMEAGMGDAVPPRLILGERPVHSVGVGASWSSDEGAGGRTFWEHRNILRGGEKLRLDLSIAEIGQIAGAQFDKPRFLRDDQNLIALFELAHEDTDAFDENRARTGLALARKLNPRLDVSAGISFEVARTEDSDGTRTHELFGLPATLRYDGSNNLLDPTEGARLGLSLTPYTGASAGPVTFLKLETTGSTYWSFGSRPDVTLAVRGRYGTLLADSRVNVPGSIRFFAGGGGSIRGYAYQEVGPLDAHNDPEGARSVVEASSEIRYRVTRTIGVVAFLDGGNAYSTSTPKLDDELQWGAGAGLRYYTPIGPVRADVGIPINRRRSVDDPFQLYFSFGQAF